MIWNFQIGWISFQEEHLIKKQHFLTDSINTMYSLFSDSIDEAVFIIDSERNW